MVDLVLSRTFGKHAPISITGAGVPESKAYLVKEALLASIAGIQDGWSAEQAETAMEMACGVFDDGTGGPDLLSSLLEKKIQERLGEGGGKPKAPPAPVTPEQEEKLYILYSKVLPMVSANVQKKKATLKAQQEARVAKARAADRSAGVYESYASLVKAKGQEEADKIWLAAHKELPVAPPTGKARVSKAKRASLAGMAI